MNFHKSLTKEKWLSYSLMTQLGNIASEAQRALSFKARGEQERAQRSLYMCLELIDLSLEDSSWKNKAKELLRLREVLCDVVLEQGQFEVSPNNLISYLSNLALLSKSES